MNASVAIQVLPTVTSDEEVVRIGHHQTAVGNLVDALAVPLVAGAPCTVNAVGGVQVDRPAAERNGVVVLVLFDDVLLGQHVVALEPPAFAFAGEKPRPIRACSSPFPGTCPNF